MKKLLASIMACSLFLCCSFVSVNAVEETSSETDLTYEETVDKIVQDLDVLGNYEIVDLTPEVAAYSGFDGAVSDQAIKISTAMGNNCFEDTFVIPLKELDDGTLLNSFTYIQTPRFNDDTVGNHYYNWSESLTDIKLTVTAYYQRVTSDPILYRMFYTKANWSKVSSSSSAYVSEMTITTSVAGEYKTYPGLQLIDDSYSDYTLVTITNPSSSRIYATDMLMSTSSSENVIELSFGANGGGQVTLTYYDANGRKRTFDRIYYCFRN